MMRRFHLGIAAAITWLAASPALPHDFWLQPQQFRIEAEETTPLTLQVGHGDARQRSLIPLRRIIRFEAFAPDGTKVDLKAGLQMEGDALGGILRFEKAGTYVLVLESDDQAQSHLPAARFNAHLKAEGLTPALEQRARTQRANEPGSEKYRRLAKAIVQVGSGGESAGSASVAVGLPLEILIEGNVRPGAPMLPIRVLHEGAPLAGALVRLTNLEQDESPTETLITGSDGRAGFMMPNKGSWLLSAVWTRPLPASHDLDFDTLFSSLSFGIEAKLP